MNKLALCKDAVKELSTCGELKVEAIFCARLKALLKFDLGEESVERDDVGVVDTGEKVSLYPDAKSCHHPFKVETGQRSGC